jgi:glycerol-3-phosphate acyltransferase PlsY
MPESIPVVILIFIITVAITRYVSLGSILAAATIIIETLAFYFLGLFIFKGKIGIEVLFIVLFLASLAIFLHRSNIKRLINHNENKFTFHPSI